MSKLTSPENEQTLGMCKGSKLHLVVLAGVSVGHCSGVLGHRHEDLGHHDEAWSPERDCQGVPLPRGCRPWRVQAVPGW